MNANYSEALEKQLQLLQWWDKPDALCLWDTDPELLQRLAKAGMAVSEEALPAMRSMLKFGETYYWGRDQCLVLQEVAKGVPPSAKIDLEMFGQAGFYWFSDPLAVPDPTNRWPILALAYVRAYEGIEFAAWEDWRHNRSLESDPDSYGYWPYGMPMGELVGRGRPSFDRMCRATLYAAATFIRQRIFCVNSLRAERHLRKRIERANMQVQPIVRVVELRRREVMGRKDGDPVEHEWSCQWLVRGHWRQQFYPSKHANQPIWITPYVKGPDDKPLKPPRATVFAVVR